MTLQDDRRKAFAQYVRALQRLRELGVIRTSRGPVADYGELVVAEHFGVSLDPNPGRKGYDLLLPDRRRVQVKARAPRPDGRMPSHWADIPDIDGDPFDLFVGVIFDAHLKVREARITTIDRVRALGRRQANGRWRLRFNALRGDDEAKELDLIE